MSDELPDGTAAFFRAPQAFLLGHAMQQGDVARFQLGGAPFALLSTPDLARQLFAGGSPTLRKGWLHDVPRTVFGEGLVTMEDEAWRPLRTLHAPFVVRLSSRDLPAAVVTSRYPQWVKAAQDGAPFDPFREARSVAFDVVLQGLFGIAPSPLTRQLAETVDEVGRSEHVTLDRVLAKAGKARAALELFKKSEHDLALQRIDPIAAELLAPYLSGDVDDGGLIASALATPEMKAASPAVRQLFARDMLMTGIMAGSLTTGDAVGWALCLLAQHEAVAEAVAKEVADSHAPGTNLLAGVINETLRLYPPIWFAGRVAAETTTIDGTTFDAGTAILCSPYVLHRLPHFWDQPARYDPLRFGAAGRRRVDAFLPFGLGPRGCIGQAIARLTMVELLGFILTRFRLLPLEGGMPEPGGAFSLSPRRPATIRLSLRPA